MSNYNDYYKNILDNIILSKFEIIEMIKNLNTGKLITNGLYIIERCRYDGSYNTNYFLNKTGFSKKMMLRDIYRYYTNCKEIKYIKPKIIYDIEQFKQYYLKFIVKDDCKGIFFNEAIFERETEKLFIILENQPKQFIRFQYLLCIISIMRQKCNFQDYGFCNYFISFL